MSVTLANVLKRNLPLAQSVAVFDPEWGPAPTETRPSWFLVLERYAPQFRRIELTLESLRHELRGVDDSRGQDLARAGLASALDGLDRIGSDLTMALNDTSLAQNQYINLSLMVSDLLRSVRSAAAMPTDVPIFKVDKAMQAFRKLEQNCHRESADVISMMFEGPGDLAYLEHIAGFRIESGKGVPSRSAIHAFALMAVDRAFDGFTQPGLEIVPGKHSQTAGGDPASAWATAFEECEDPVDREARRLDTAPQVAVIQGLIDVVNALRGEHKEIIRLRNNAEARALVRADWALTDLYPGAAHEGMPLTSVRGDLARVAHLELHGLAQQGLHRYAEGIAQDKTGRLATNQVLTWFAQEIEILTDLATRRIEAVLEERPDLRDALAQRLQMPVPLPATLETSRRAASEQGARVSAVIARVLTHETTPTLDFSSSDRIPWPRNRSKTETGLVREQWNLGSDEFTDNGVIASTKKWNRTARAERRKRIVVRRRRTSPQVGVAALLAGMDATETTARAILVKLGLRKPNRAELVSAVHMTAGDVRRQAALNVASREVANELSGPVGSELGRAEEILASPPVRVTDDDARRPLIRPGVDTDGRAAILVQRSYADECLRDGSHHEALRGGLAASITRLWQPQDPNVLFTSMSGAFTATGTLVPTDAPLRLGLITFSGAAVMQNHEARIESVRNADRRAVQAGVGDVHAHLAAERAHRHHREVRSGPLGLLDRTRDWAERRSPNNPALRAQALRPTRDTREGPDDHGTSNRPSGPSPRTGPPLRDAHEQPRPKLPTRDQTPRRDERQPRDDGRTDPSTRDASTRGVRRRGAEPRVPELSDRETPSDASRTVGRYAEQADAAVVRDEQRADSGEQREIAPERRSERMDESARPDDGPVSTPAHPLELSGRDEIDSALPPQRNERSGRDDLPGNAIGTTR